MFYLVALACVLGIAVGQILFKISANDLHKTGSLFAPSTFFMIFGALALYGITTIAWIWVLQKIELGKAYPLMAFAFVIVPIGSYIFLGERFTPQYAFGICLIVCGIILAVRS